MGIAAEFNSKVGHTQIDPLTKTVRDPEESFPFVHVTIKVVRNVIDSVENNLFINAFGTHCENDLKLRLNIFLEKAYYPSVYK